MKLIGDIFAQEGFLKVLFEAMPCGVLVVDKDRRVQAVNDILEQTFGLSEATVLNKLGGDALGCIHAYESPKGCGHTPSCQTCQIKNTAMDAIAGAKVSRRKAWVQLTKGGIIKDMVLLVSAAPIKYGKEKFAIVILEDITELNGLRRRLKTEQSFAGIVGRDEKIQELFETIREVAEAKVPVLIEGESGTGKELVAAAIHNEGLRANKQFVPVNCGALPDGLLESELFGHVKGAFTGAIRDKKGRFQLADGGTIFLDEVGDLSPIMQVKLLRVLQEGTFEPVGSEKTIKVDVRMISATNKNLRKEVAAARFREDLFYRICVMPISIPPLRTRKNDIPLLVEYFFEKTAQESKTEKAILSKEALAALMDYDWPGNVRELQNSLQFAQIKARGQPIEPHNLPPTIFQTPKERSSRKPRRKKLEKTAVNKALLQVQGNKVKAAKLLGVSRATLYRFIEDELGSD